MKIDAEQRLVHIASKAKSGQKISPEEEAFVVACIDETLKRLEKNFGALASSAGAEDAK